MKHAYLLPQCSLLDAGCLHFWFDKLRVFSVQCIRHECAESIDVVLVCVKAVGKILHIVQDTTDADSVNRSTPTRITSAKYYLYIVCCYTSAVSQLRGFELTDSTVVF